MQRSHAINGLLGALLVLAIVVPLPGFSRITFERVYGGRGDDIGYSVEETQDGGYMVLGAFECGGGG